MAEKNVPFRFTIGFSPGDPSHQQVAELLNQQGRRKAQFIVNAVLHYINCPETVDVPERGSIHQPERDELEAMIARILRERGYLQEPGEREEPFAAHSKAKPKESSIDLGDADIAAITDSLSAFRDT